MSEDRHLSLETSDERLGEHMDIQASSLKPQASALSVELEIGELVLRGFEHTDRHRVGAAVEHELARLLGERPLPAGIEHAAELARLDGGSIELPAGAPAETLGARIAQAIYRCCSGEMDQ